MHQLRSLSSLFVGKELLCTPIKDFLLFLLLILCQWNYFISLFQRWLIKHQLPSLHLMFSTVVSLLNWVKFIHCVCCTSTVLYEWFVVFFFFIPTGFINHYTIGSQQNDEFFRKDQNHWKPHARSVKNSTCFERQRLSLTNYFMEFVISPNMMRSKNITTLDDRTLSFVCTSCMLSLLWPVKILVTHPSTWTVVVHMVCAHSHKPTRSSIHRTATNVNSRRLKNRKSLEIFAHDGQGFLQTSVFVSRVWFVLDLPSHIS